MAEINHTLARFREVLRYDPDTGILQRVGHGPLGFRNQRGALKFKLDGRQYLVHRVAWLLVHGVEPIGCIEHLNGDLTDNRLINLVEVPIAAGIPTAATMRETFDYDASSGVIRWRVTRANFKRGDIAGSEHKGYIRISVGGTRILAHRLAWLLVHGDWPEQQIDHINGDGRDNRLINLRDVTPLINSQNQRKQMSRNTSGYLGVSWSKAHRKFLSSIRVNKKTIRLGQFDDPEEASRIYMANRRALMPGNTL